MRQKSQDELVAEIMAAMQPKSAPAPRVRKAKVAAKPPVAAVAEVQRYDDEEEELLWLLLDA